MELLELVAATGLSLVFLAVVFRPLELVFPARPGQRFFRPDWFTDLCFFAGQYLLWGGLALWILSLFGREIGEGGMALTILALGYLLNAMTGGASTVLLMTGRSKTVMLNTVVYGIVLVVGTALLIPQWGILGAAVSASCALIGLNVLRVWQVWQSHRILPWTWTMLKPLAAGVVMDFVLIVAKPYVGLAWSIPLAGLGVLVYFGALYAARLEADDRVIVAATLARLRPAGN